MIRAKSELDRRFTGAIRPTRCCRALAIEVLEQRQLLAAPAADATAELRQIVTPSATRIEASAQSSFGVALDYSTSNGSTTPGLHLRLHFDSSALSLTEFTELLDEGLLANQVSNDSCVGEGCGGFDNDPSTDRFLNLIWIEDTQPWPSNLPARLLSATFTVASTFDSATTIRFSGNAAAGFALDTSDIVVMPVTGLDFGDAPTAAQSGLARSYPTTLSDDGARHARGALRLGNEVDYETDGAPTQNADGDGGDEDGVSFITALVSAQNATTTASVGVTSSQTGKLDAWIDFNQDGDWLDPTEKLFATSVDVTAGTNLVSFHVPPSAAAGSTFARFRLSTDGGLAPTGLSGDGEVEDHMVEVFAAGAANTLGSIDLAFGNADLESDGDEAVVRQDGHEVFRAPVAALMGWVVDGDDGNNRFRVDELSGSHSLSYDAKLGDDALEFTGGGLALDLTDSTTNSLSSVETIDIVGDGANSLALNQAAVDQALGNSSPLLLIHDTDDHVEYAGDDWGVTQPILNGGQHRHVLSVGTARVEVINGLPYQNPLASTDVNLLSGTSPIDALRVINFLARRGPEAVDLSQPPSVDDLQIGYVDVNGSQSASPIDALLVINFLARQQNQSIESERLTFDTAQSGWRMFRREGIGFETTLDAAQTEVSGNVASFVGPESAFVGLAIDDAIGKADNDSDGQSLCPTLRGIVECRSATRELNSLL